jgi:hypothetical protein
MTKTMPVYKNDAFITIMQHDNGSHTVTMDTKLPNDYGYMLKLEFDAYSPNSKNLDMFMDLVKGTQEQVDLERMGRKPTVAAPMPDVLINPAMKPLRIWFDGKCVFNKDVDEEAAKSILGYAQTDTAYVKDNYDPLFPGPLMRDNTDQTQVTEEDTLRAHWSGAPQITLVAPLDKQQTTVRFEFISQTVSGSAIGVMSSYKFRDMLAYVEPLGGASTDE